MDILFEQVDYLRAVQYTEMDCSLGVCGKLFDQRPRLGGQIDLACSLGTKLDQPQAEGIFRALSDLTYKTEGFKGADGLVGA